MKKTVLIADIKSSKNIGGEKRINIQKKFDAIVDIVNIIYTDLFTEINFSAGDSVQGVFKNTASAISCSLLIKAFMYPYDIRCGIGVGNILDTGFKETNRMDGEAYHNARSALDICKKEDYNLLINSKTEYDIFINQYFLNAQSFEQKQSKKQKFISNLVFLLSPVGSNVFSADYIPCVTGFIYGNPEDYNIQYISNLQNSKFNFSGAGNREFNDYAKDNLIVMDKKVDESSLRQLAALYGVTSENIRQMIAKANINEIKKNYICAISLSERIIGGN